MIRSGTSTGAGSLEQVRRPGDPGNPRYTGRQVWNRQRKDEVLIDVHFCASEQMAAVPIPSLTSAEAFDSGVLLGPVAARRLLDHGRQAYAAARRVERRELVSGLGVVKDRGEAR